MTRIQINEFRLTVEHEPVYGNNSRIFMTKIKSKGKTTFYVQRVYY